jgi:ADP-heptose:LPS heptosyltransferase
MILNQKVQEGVFWVRSLEEARGILFSAETSVIKTFIFTLFIEAWVFGANFLLKILKYLFFRQRFYSREEFSNIVIYTVGIVGDNVVMLPALTSIRRRYPGAAITVIANCQMWDPNGAIGVMGASPYKDLLIVVNEDPVQRRGFKLWMDKSKFGGIKCDLFVNLSPFGNRGWIGAVVREMIFAQMLGAKHAIGFKMSTYGQRRIFNRIQYRFVINEPRRSREVLRELGLKPIENVDLLPHDPMAKESVSRKLKKFLADDTPLFVINPGGKFQAQCWPAERFGDIATWLSYCRYKRNC